MASCGTRYAYNLGCRCWDCTRVNREYARKQRAAEKAQFVAARAAREVAAASEGGGTSCGTASGYVQGCRCDSCREANREAVNAHRVKKRREADAERVAQPKFPNHLNELRHAMTIEEWQAREAADPGCRPVTQAPIQVRAERLPDLGDGLTVVDRIIAEALRD